MASEIKIRNKSKETISLIPFSCPIGVDPRSAFPVETRLAKNIPAGKLEKVKLKHYDSSDTVTDSQIHMLFRAGEFPQEVKALADEKLFLCTGQSGLSAKAEWNLTLDEKRLVSGGPGLAAGPTSSGANAAGSRDARLGELKEQVQKLKQDLLKRIAAIEELLDKLK